MYGRDLGNLGVEDSIPDKAKVKLHKNRKMLDKTKTTNLLKEACSNGRNLLQIEWQ